MTLPGTFGFLVAMHQKQVPIINLTKRGGAITMEEQNLFDRTYNFILTKIVETAQAPHYTEIATALGVPMEEGRKVLHDLFSQRIAAWLFPGTDYITSLTVS